MISRGRSLTIEQFVFNGQGEVFNSLRSHHAADPQPASAVGEFWRFKSFPLRLHLSGGGGGRVMTFRTFVRLEPGAYAWVAQVEHFKLRLRGDGGSYPSPRACTASSNCAEYSG